MNTLACLGILLAAVTPSFVNHNKVPGNTPTMTNMQAWSATVATSSDVSGIIGEAVRTNWLCTVAAADAKFLQKSTARMKQDALTADDAGGGIVVSNKAYYAYQMSNGYVLYAATNEFTTEGTYTYVYAYSDKWCRTPTGGAILRYGSAGSYTYGYFWGGETTAAYRREELDGNIAGMSLTAAAQAAVADAPNHALRDAFAPTWGDDDEHMHIAGDLWFHGGTIYKMIGGTSSSLIKWSNMTEGIDYTRADLNTISDAIPNAYTKAEADAMTNAVLGSAVSASAAMTNAVMQQADAKYLPLTGGEAVEDFVLVSSNDTEMLWKVGKYEEGIYGFGFANNNRYGNDGLWIEGAIWATSSNDSYLQGDWFLGDETEDGNRIADRYFVTTNVEESFVSATNAAYALIDHTLPHFSNEVMQVGLGISSNDVAVIREMVGTIGNLPIGGGVATLGGLLMAIIASLKWLKSNKANTADLPIALTVYNTSPISTLDCVDGHAYTVSQAGTASATDITVNLPQVSNAVATAFQATFVNTSADNTLTLGFHSHSSEEQIKFDGNDCGVVNKGSSAILSAMWNGTAWNLVWKNKAS